jgi:ferritin-like metal-binding protein YciE
MLEIYDPLVLLPGTIRNLNGFMIQQEVVMMKLDTLEDLLVEQLRDLYSTEQQLTGALPKMAEASYSTELKKAFNEHTDITRNQLGRLNQIYSKLGLSPGGEESPGTSGIVKQGEQLIATPGNPVVKDAALIAAAQRVEHYEIAGYGSARAYAHELGYKDVEKLLQETLDEEGVTDKKLTRIAEGGLFSGGINKETPR